MSKVGVRIAVVEWHVVRVTPQGVWLTCRSSPYIKKRWASVASRAFATTRARAIDKLIERRERQVRILEQQLQVANDTLIAARRALQ